MPWQTRQDKTRQDKTRQDKTELSYSFYQEVTLALGATCTCQSRIRTSVNSAACPSPKILLQFPSPWFEKQTHKSACQFFLGAAVPSLSCLVFSCLVFSCLVLPVLSCLGKSPCFFPVKNDAAHLVAAAEPPRARTEKPTCVCVFSRLFEPFIYTNDHFAKTGSGQKPKWNKTYDLVASRR
eukprot:COSAG06_NODE_2301_length_7120_cov_3.535251_3_plen_181_part_00